MGAVVASMIVAISTSVGASAADRIDYPTLVAGLSQNRVMLIDVREPGEFTEGHVPGAINLPLSTLKAEAVPKPADRTVVVMCRSGRRSAQAMAILSAAGRTDVVDYSGSWNDWVAHSGAVATGR
jgi:rhodanese-related sulfurtransferase